MLIDKLYRKTGVTNLTTLQDDSNKIIPDYYTSKVSDIFEFMGP